MSKGSYSVKYVAEFIKRYGMKAQIFCVGRGAVLYGNHPFFSCPLNSIESNICSYNYVRKVFCSL